LPTTNHLNEAAVNRRLAGRCIVPRVGLLGGDYRL